MSLWLVCLLLAAAPPDPLDAGRKALEANHPDEALTLFQQAAAAEPGDYAAHFHLALAHSLLQHDAEAIAEYRKTLDLKPKLYQAELNLGIVLLRQRQGADAVAPLESAVEAKPAEYRPQYYLAEALRQSDRAALAQPHYEAALKADPKSAAAELGLARSLLAQNRLPDAEGHFRSAAALDPSFRDALLELAAAFEKNGRGADAIPIYRQFPQDPGAQERLSQLLIESRQVADAIPHLERAVKDSPTSANRIALASAYTLNKEPAKSIALLQQVVSAEPANFDAHMQLGRTLRDQRDFPAAANQFFEAAKLNRNSKEAWSELASVLIIHQDYAQGIAALDQVKALGGDTPGSRFLRAITLDKMNLAPQAVAAYREFLATSEGHYPDQEFQARQRLRILEKELHKR